MQDNDYRAVNSEKTIFMKRDGTFEAEHYSASPGAVEVIYLRQLLLDMGFGPTSPTPVYEDNTACIEWTNNVIGARERARHIDIPQLGHLRLKRASECPPLIS